jgi:hypothetical protein
MRFRKLGLVLSLVAALAVPVGIGAVASPSQATTYDQFCGTNNECLNDWSNGTSVRLYAPNVTNDAYYPDAVDRCQSGSNLTTANCPISGIPAGYSIYQMKDERKANACIGNDSSGGSYATEVGCNIESYPGNGGGYGTLVILITDGTCNGNYGDIVNAYWSNQFGGWGSRASIGGQGGSSGSLVYLSDSSDWCWSHSLFNG